MGIRGHLSHGHKLFKSHAFHKHPKIWHQCHYMAHAGRFRGLKEKGESGNAKITFVNTVSFIYSHLFSLFHLWPNNDVIDSGYIIHQNDRFFQGLRFSKIKKKI